MSRLLTSRQAEELHKSIIAYLLANNFNESATIARNELKLSEEDFSASTAKKYESLLEKKWTGVVRLQKKIMELESHNATLQAELQDISPLSLAKRNSDPSTWLPRAPARHALQSHRDTINCLAFHPIFSSIATGSDDCSIKIWDWELGELEKTIKGHTRPVLGLDYGGPRSSTLLASCSSDLTVKLWAPADDYQNVRTLLGHEHSISAVRFIPAAGQTLESNLLVSVGRDMTLRIWDVTTGYCVRTLRDHTAWVRDVCPSWDGRYLLSTGDDSTARLWDLQITSPNAKPLQTFFGHEHTNECCAIAPPTTYQYLGPLAGLKKSAASTHGGGDGLTSAEFLATGSRDKSIKIWDKRGTCLLTLIGHDNWVRALVFHPGGKYLLSVSDDKSLRCWDLSQDGKCVKTLGDTHERFVTCLRWAPSLARKSAPAGETTGTLENGASQTVKGKQTEAESVKQIRCVLATGGVDQQLRIFAN